MTELFTLSHNSLLVNYKRLLLICLLLLSSTGCRLLRGSSSAHLQKAEELSRQKQYDQAVEEYRSHMLERLAIKNRPEWENPYFYLILIGDIQLGQDHPDLALQSYLDADKNGVDEALISDRYRSLAQWHELHDQLQIAVDLLRTRREKDPLIFDSILDRLSKEIVKREEKGNSSSTKSH